MKRIFVSFIGFIFLLAAKSQSLSHIHKDPYVVVDSIATDFKYLVIDPHHIKEVTVLKGANAHKRMAIKHGRVLLLSPKS